MKGASYAFLAVGDLHYDREAFHVPGAAADDGYIAMWKARMPAFLDRMARRARAERAAFALQLGDFANAPFADFDIQCRALEEAWTRIDSALGVTTYPVMGNHESYKAHGYPAYRHVMTPKIAALLGAPSGASHHVHYAFMRGVDLFVAIDTNRADMFDFVQETFARHPESRYVFVMGHAPILPSSTGQVGYLTPFELDPRGRLLALLQSRNAIYLCGDLHTLGFCEYVGSEGRFVQIAASSVCTDAKRAFQDGPDYPATTEEAAGARRAVGGDASPVWRRFRDGMVRHWVGDGAMFYVVHVSDARVVATLHLHDREEPAKMFVLHDADTDVQPLGMDLPRYFTPGANAVSLRKPPSLAALPTAVAFDLPEGWKVEGGNPVAMPGAEATVRIVRPAEPRLSRRPERIRARLLDGEGRLRANAFAIFLHQDVLDVPRHDSAARLPHRPPMGFEGAPGRRLEFSWDEERLHVAARLRDETFSPLPPEAAEAWWTGPSLELFLDLRDAKADALDGETWQVALVPVEGAATRILLLTTGPDGRQVVDRSGRGIEARHAFDAAAGVLEIVASIPWTAVRPVSGPFAPHAGAVVGADAAYRDAPLLGGAVKIHDNPSAWGRFRLVEGR